MWAGPVLVIGLLAACGGRVSAGDDAGGQPMTAGGTKPVPTSMTTGSDDEGGAGTFPVCPARPPAIGAACEMPADEGCSYQEFASGAWTCSAFVCSSGTWAKASGGC
jgi:hypothetical protein